ncbi:MAG: M23 family metallopeptidase [Candidatus Pelagibacterales bacterium]|jgi:murein DD-endopeptidase MepM/ murein hydrolase activator NlpD|tara:strand:- start:8703 stop:9503 length:801 start_codon:yes stop_codon:yes gene_type:complete
MKFKLAIIFIIIFFTKNSLSQVLPETTLQGSLIVGQLSQGDQITLNGNKLKLSKNKYFVFAVGRDELGPLNIAIFENKKLLSLNQIKIITREYDIQKINGLPEKMVTPDEEILKKIIADNKIISKAKLLDLDNVFFKKKFLIPTNGVISGVFGSQRILNEKPKSPHRGLDIAAPKGELVYATNDGIITLAEDNLYYTGGTIIIDHGHGVKSIYAHLSAVDVVNQQRIKKGEMIGKVGSTGRSTGPHLHWGVMWFNEYVDPQLLISQ